MHFHKAEHIQVGLFLNQTLEKSQHTSTLLIRCNLNQGRDVHL